LPLIHAAVSMGADQNTERISGKLHHNQTKGRPSTVSLFSYAGLQNVTRLGS